MSKNQSLIFAFVFWLLLPVSLSAQTSFTDVTDQAGVGDTNFGVGVAWGDFDRDGRLDLYLVNLGQGNVLYLNKGDGTFEDVSFEAGVGDPGDGVGCAWGDYNNDGLLDLFMSNRPGYHRLYHNNGDTTFTDKAPEFGMSDPFGMGESVAWGDYDNDGFVDLYVVRMMQTNILYRNVAGGDFEDVTAFAGVGDNGRGEATAWCDYDDDGDQDLYLANAYGYNLLYRNDGDGTFTDFTDSAGIREYANSFGCAWGDYDNDGDFDLYVGRQGANKLYANNGDGTFEDVTSEAGVGHTGWSLGVSWGDYDNDGWLDLHLANHQGDDVLYRNLGDGTFEDVTDQAGVHNFFNGRGDIWGDYNGDGFLDLYVSNHDGARNVLFENNGNDNHFLHLRLIGVLSNKDGIGSKVVSVCGEVRMTRQIEGGSGFASQNSLPVEFGLAANTVVDSVYIYWTSGHIDTLTELAADQFLEVVEGVGLGISCEVLSPLFCRGKNFYFSVSSENSTGSPVEVVMTFSAYVDFDCDPANLLVSIPRNRIIPEGTNTTNYFFKVPNAAPPGSYSASVGFTYGGQEYSCCVNTTIVQCSHWRVGENAEWGLEEVDHPEVALPSVTSLAQGYPNPFNAVTEIRYTLAEEGEVVLEVYNLKGQLVESLVNGWERAGVHTITWKPAGIGSGLYLCKLAAAGRTRAVRLTLLK
jgi:hypothetical protein